MEYRPSRFVVGLVIGPDKQGRTNVLLRCSRWDKDRLGGNPIVVEVGDFWPTAAGLDP